MGLIHKMSSQNQGHVLAVGIIILFLASLLSFSAWNIARSSFKAASNYQKKMFAKQAAFIALQSAEEKLKLEMDAYQKQGKFNKSNGFCVEASLCENPMALPYKAEAWNDQNSQTVVKTLSSEYKKQPRFFIRHLVGTKEPGSFYFKVVVIGWSTVESCQVLTAFYRFKRDAAGAIEGKRLGLYVF